ncbi:unnamed protein product [Choristocarpus tenellus]
MVSSLHSSSPCWGNASAGMGDSSGNSSSSGGGSFYNSTSTPLALCPIFIAENAFQAFEIMAGESAGKGGAGVGGSLVGRTLPLHFRFLAYSQVTKTCRRFH